MILRQVPIMLYTRFINRSTIRFSIKNVHVDIKQDKKKFEIQGKWCAKCCNAFCLDICNQSTPLFWCKIYYNYYKIDNLVAFRLDSVFFLPKSGKTKFYKHVFKLWLAYVHISIVGYLDFNVSLEYTYLNDIVQWYTIFLDYIYKQFSC